MRAMSLFILGATLLLTGIAHAIVQGDGSDSLAIRAGDHDDFLRIVFEGNKEVISRGKAILEEKEVTVRFSGLDINVKKAELTVAYSIEKDVVRFTLKKEGRLESFILDNPSRLVIDIYGKKEEKTDEKTPENGSIEKKEPISREGRKETVLQKREVPDPSEVTDTTSPEKPVTRQTEGDFIPERYKAMWSLLESGNFFAVLKELPAYEPKEVELRAAFYYIYAGANIKAKQYMDAVKYLRLAYIFSNNHALKEHALIKRAVMYKQMKLDHEARADYIVFIRDFPSSEFIESAHFGLAESLYRIGLYQEAVEHYRKAGHEPKVLYSMANALQRLEKTGDAEKVYETAKLKDMKYPRSSPETYYLMGENMRIMGKYEEAKKHMSVINLGPFRDSASISLGLIAMEETDTNEAFSKFQEAARSIDPKIQVQALFHLSLALIKSGKFKEATQSLEKIRREHIDSNMYKDTLLVLAKLYKKEDRLKESVSLLKELVYGKKPPREAFDELERIVIKAGNSSKESDLKLVDLWNQVGQWLIDESREDFLVTVAGKLRNEGKPFIDLCLWLVANGSQHAKGTAAVALADYNIGIGNNEMSKKYIAIAKESEKSGDDVLRVEARIYLSEDRKEAALKKILMIKNIEKEDLGQLAGIISDLRQRGSVKVKDALVFYEGALKKSDGNAEDYTNLADILYSMGERGKALEYYKLAYARQPDDEWAMYRVGRDASNPESRDILDRLQNGDTLFGRLAKSKLMEITLQSRVQEVF